MTAIDYRLAYISVPF